MTREVPSPCTGQCRLDADRTHCTGCARTPDEIRRWHRAGPGERAAILRAVRDREVGEVTRLLRATAIGPAGLRVD